MSVPVEDLVTREAALAYVIALYHELTEENGAPTLGTQNQAVDFILADPALRRGVSEWAANTEIGEATTAPPRRLPQDALYIEIRSYMESIMERPIFKTPAQPVH